MASKYGIICASKDGRNDLEAHGVERRSKVRPACLKSSVVGRKCSGIHARKSCVLYGLGIWFENQLTNNT